MAINFPDSPTDNQEFNGYIYDAVRGVWDVKLASDPLGSLNLTSPAAGEALVFDGTSWVNQEVATPASVKTIDSDSIAIDFSDGIPLEKRTVAGDVIFTAINYTAGIKKTIYFEGDTVQRSLTFPNEWTFLTDTPTAIGANKNNILDLNSFGTSASTTVGIWLGASSFEPITASGGSETDIVIAGITYRVHSFYTSGAFSVSSPGSIGEVEYLIVAGGGGGGGYYSGGGGGAGGLITNISGASSGGNTGPSSNLNIVASSYTVSIGAGGTGGAADASTDGGNGQNSSFAGIVALGGGGAGSGGRSGFSGGSGGGSGGGANFGGAGTSGQGFAGGNGGGGTPNYGAGGGGGTGGAGQNGSTSISGSAGDGTISSITGNAYYYGGGGGAGTHTGTNSTRTLGGLGGGGDGGLGGGNNSGFAGDANTGGGGGGGTYQNNIGALGGTGGSGIVIVRYPITDPN